MAATELAPGAALGTAGRYRLKHVVGTGGMASVWLATDSQLDRPVAVKILSDVLALDRSFVTRFAREARVAASLSHPHLVKVFDFNVDTDRPYLVMEYVPGGTLAERLKDPAPPDWDPEVLARELLDALCLVHGAGVVHRDIKPGNVLFDADGRARLTDFGIAQPSGTTDLTATGMVIGSARYIAPEVMSGGPASPRSDLYSLGVVIERCLTASATSRLRGLVGALTEELPERRPASAERALAWLDQELTVQAPRTAPEYEPARIYRNRPKLHVDWRNSPAVLVVGAVVLLLVVIALSSSGGGSRVPSSGPAPTSPHASLASQLTQLGQAITASRQP